MNFTKILKSLFGDKSSRDMKLIQPFVEQAKAAAAKVESLDNDALRQRTKELQKQVQDSASAQKARITELKATIENTPIDERADIFAQIDKIEKEVLDIYEKALDEVMPEVFAIVKETARRFAENEETVVTATDFDRELAADPKKDFITIDGDKAIYHNHWTAGGNDLKWEMIHYDVQLFGGTVLHQGKIAEMATGEGKTLVATLPVFLNALTQSVTLNGWGRSICSMVSLWIVSTSTSPTQRPVARLIRLISLSVPTTSSASTICVITWQYLLPISCSVLITTPSSMRLTPC